VPSNATDVLVIGAGPTGLVLAGELLRRGLTVRIVDKLAAPTPHSRALGVHARSLEILDDLGIADELISRGLRIAGATMQTARGALATVSFDALDTRYPFILCVSQVETESVLRDLLAARGGTIERERELVSFAQRDDGIEALVKTPSGTELVHASWIVGCDGAHSAVRHALGVEFEGHAYEETFVLADVCIDGDLPRDHVATYLHDDGVAAFFPMKGERWRVVASNAERLGATPTHDDVRALVEPRIGHAIAMRDPAWISPFRIHCRQVARYRQGRAFLAGDAAHIHSPVGGQGMNTGMQDAHNLAWKLALVARGHAPVELLDSYHVERHAIGKRVLAQTDRATRVGMWHGLAASLRNQVMRLATSFEPVRRAIAREAAELEVGYEDSPIVGEHVRSALLARVGRAEAGESPSLGSRRAFGAGPRPGARALDATVRRAGAARATPLRKLVRGDAFTLLLCDGRSASADGYARLAAIAARVTERFGDRVASFVVTPLAERPAELPAELAVLHDDTGDVEARYGCATECVYLIRPDLYVGFRSQPADGDTLVAHLDRVLVAGTA
jgi:2-polyprenyl-6-methoxyphenol hydroxylase-like FAD-dependent oxidoreductase